MIRWSLLTAAFVLGGCSTLDEIPEHECGNGVLEYSEDCDGAALVEIDGVAVEGTCVSERIEDPGQACLFVCDSDEGIACPAGFACDAPTGEGRCHRPSENFVQAPGSPWPLEEGEDFEVGDVDGDGNDDVISIRGAKLTIRRGHPTGEFGEALDLLVPTTAGRPAFGMLDDDDRLDMVVPTERGLAVFQGDPDLGFEPVPQSSISESEDVRFVSIQPRQGVLTPVVAITSNRVSIYGGASSQVYGPVAGVAQLGSFAAGDLDFDLVAAPELGILDPSSGTIYLFEIRKGALNDQILINDVPTVSISPPEGYFTGEMMFADASNLTAGGLAPDGFLDLVVEVQDGTALETVVYPGNGDGTFNGAAEFRIRGFPFVVAELSDTPNLPVASIERRDFITRDGLFIDVDLQVPWDDLEPDLAGLGPWGDAVVGDFNRDDVLDFATAYVPSVGLELVEIYLGTESGEFNRFTVPTPGLVEVGKRTMMTGDFDGDLVDDVAFVVRGEDSTPTALYVVFGSTSGGFDAPVPMMRLEDIRDVERVTLEDVDGDKDAIDDLLIAASNGDNGTIGTRLFGDTSRKMSAPYTLKRDGGNTVEVYVPRAVAIGELDDLPGGDVYALARRREAPIAGILDKAWRISGATTAVLEPGVGPVTGLPSWVRADCSLVSARDLNPGQTAIDEILVLPIEGGATGCDAPPTPSKLNLFVTSTEVGDDDTQLEVGAFTNPRETSVTDWNVDGSRDLAVQFAADADQSASGMLLYDTSGGSVVGATVAEQIEVGGASAVSHRWLQFDTDPHPDACFLTSQGDVIVSKFDPETGEYDQAHPLAAVDPDPMVLRIEDADVNGDGLEDLIVQMPQAVGIFLMQPAPPIGSELYENPVEDMP